MKKVFLAGKITKKLQHLWGNRFLYLDFSIFLTCEKSFVYSPPKTILESNQCNLLGPPPPPFPLFPHFLNFWCLQRKRKRRTESFAPFLVLFLTDARKEKFSSAAECILSSSSSLSKGGGGSYIYCLPVSWRKLEGNRIRRKGGKKKKKEEEEERVLLEWGWNFLPKPKREKGPLLAPTFGRHVSFENFRELISGLF